MPFFFNKCYFLSLIFSIEPDIFVLYLERGRLKRTSMIQSQDRREKGLAKVGLCLLILMMTFGYSLAQGWERTYGGIAEDYAEAVISTSDWGTLTVGYSSSFSSDNDPDIYVVRTDADGEILWSRVYDEASIERAYDAIETQDGGFLIAGEISSNEAPGNLDAYLLKISASGDIEWSRQYGGDALESLNGLAQAKDGGYILTGRILLSDDDHNDILVIKVAADGAEEWTKTYGSLFGDIGNVIAPFEDGYVLGGIKDNTDETVGSDMVLYRLADDGTEVWSKSFGSSDNEELEDLVVTRDGQIAIAGHVANFTSSYVAKYDAEGELIWEKELNISEANEDQLHAIVEQEDGSLVSSGLISPDGVDVDLLLVKMDKDGNLIWTNSLGTLDQVEGAEALAISPNGGYILAGYSSNLIEGLVNDMVLFRTDDLGNALASKISGKVYFDRDGQCDEDENDTPIEGWLVKVESSENVYFGTTDADGEYRILVDTGDYKVSLLTPTDLWKSCVASYDIQLQNFYDSTRLEFPTIVNETCPYLEVEVSTMFPPFCRNADYFINYSNEGTATATGTYIELSLDPALRVDTASMPYVAVGEKLRFQIDDLDAFERGEIMLTVSSCEEDEGLIEGEALEVKAEIFSSVLCKKPGEGWDGSSITVTGVCEQDSVAFTIENAGDSDMSESLQYYIVEDVVVFRQDEFKLNAGGFQRIPLEKRAGATYRIISEQSKGHPGSLFPTFAVEGCVEDGQSFSTGFVTMFPENDQDPYISIDVQEVSDGSISEVELRGHPKGYDNKFIAQNTDLSYKIVFSNFGNDTISRVVIRDTLPLGLDITTVVPGTSSHPYTFEIYEQGILKITFSDITLLPGGSAAGTQSRGFVNFTVSQKPDNPEGTLIENSAAIFFDYRKPVQTNLVSHTVGVFPQYVTVSTTPTFVPGIKIKVSPNPFIESTVFEIEDEGTNYDVVMFSLYDLQGKLLRREQHQGKKFEVYRNQLTAGMYLFSVASKGKIISTGKILVQ